MVPSAKPGKQIIQIQAKLQSEQGNAEIKMNSPGKDILVHLLGACTRPQQNLFVGKLAGSNYTRKSFDPFSKPRPEP